MKVRIISLIIALKLIEEVSLQYEGCDYFEELKPDTTYFISSPRNSENLLWGDDCRWAAEASFGNKILLNCNEVRIQPSISCYGDSILVSMSGRTDLSDAKRYCGMTSFSETSTSTKITIALKTRSVSIGVRFKCSLQAVASNCSCGQVNRGRIG